VQSNAIRRRSKAAPAQARQRGTTSYSATFTNRHDRAGKTLTPSGVAFDGFSGGEYDVTFVAIATGTITPRPITVTATTNTKVH
jgi:hypothetical protein